MSSLTDGFLFFFVLICPGPWFRRTSEASEFRRNRPERCGKIIVSGRKTLKIDGIRRSIPTWMTPNFLWWLSAVSPPERTESWLEVTGKIREHSAGILRPSSVDFRSFPARNGPYMPWPAYIFLFIFFFYSIYSWLFLFWYYHCRCIIHVNDCFIDKDCFSYMKNYLYFFIIIIDEAIQCIDSVFLIYFSFCLFLFLFIHNCCGHEHHNYPDPVTTKYLEPATTVDSLHRSRYAGRFRQENYENSLPVLSSEETPGSHWKNSETFRSEYCVQSRRFPEFSYRIRWFSASFRPAPTKFAWFRYPESWAWMRLKMVHYNPINHNNQ